MADLQELFARLKSPSNPASSPGASQSSANANTYHQPTVSSPIFSPQPGGPPPHHQSAIVSPNTSAMGTPAPDPSSTDRTASLLNLLKFNQPSAPSPQNYDTGAERRPSNNTFQHPEHPPPQPAHSRGVSASDLVASFMRKPQSPAAIAQPAPTRPEFRSDAASSENPQDLLLRLLNHPKPPQNDSPALPPQNIERDVSETRVDDLARDLADATLEASSYSAETQAVPPMHAFGSGSQPPANHSSAPKSMFTYVNPFEQLSASSPRNRTPKPESRTHTPKVEVLKHGRESSPNPGPASKTRKLSGADPATSAREPENVAEAVAEVGQAVDKQVEEALAGVDKHNKGANGNQAAEETFDQKDLATAVHDVAMDAKEQLEDKETRREFEESMPKELAKAIEDVVEDVAQEKVADSWESAEDSPGKDDNTVNVFNFPMRPFVSIELKKLREPPLPIRQDNIMDIARLKKDFDQIDRNLVTVSKTFIAYALSKHGGFRLIRQDTGKYKQVFNTTKERIFNLQICTGPPVASYDAETILATGVDGSVFWTTVAGHSDTYGEENLEDQGFSFPPVPAQDDNTSGGQLKTRAKKSSRHPEFFGIGRGKSIYLVWPHAARQAEYTDVKTRVCDSEKYLQHRCLRIVTGKAGKDFAFSEDDTVIASLDKAGRLRFWDIRDLITEGTGPNTGRISPKEVRTPIMQLSTVAAGDKSWPTSVLFLDKERPCAKGIALRYLVVGLKQNHTLQLWDIGLQKPVQEINFPHENESDAICSVAYHPKTGILAVGHPTRNSIYFIHLSAPRYNLPAMSQAKFLTRLVEKDAELPRPESTAIMSGIREYSFASKGQLRSLEMLQEPAASPESFAPDEAPLFELYVMHSKGVTCLGIRKEDLGWSKESKVLHPIDAEANGSIIINPIRLLALAEGTSTTESSANGEAQQSTQSSRSRPVPREVVKKEPASSRSRATSQAPDTASMIASTLERVENQQDAARAAIINGSEKPEKKKKKKGAATATDAASQVSTAAKPASAAPSTVSYANVAQRAKTPPPEPVKAVEEKKGPESEIPEWATRLLGQLQAPNAASSASANIDTESLKALETNVSTEFNRTFTKELESLYRRLDNDSRAQEAAGAAKMDAVLRLVSSTLTENVEKSMSRIVTQNLQKIILPSLSDLVAATIERRLTEILATSVQSSVPREVKQTLPHAVNLAFKDPETMRHISELVANKTTSHIDQQLGHVLRNTIGSSVQNITVNAVQQMAADMERRMAEQVRQAELQRQRDAAKIDQLTNLVTGLSETVASMSASQASFQDEILKLQKHVVRSEESAKAPSTAQSVASSVKKSEGELEQEQITRLMSEGQYEEGTIMWLQSPRQTQLFDNLFVRCNPAYIRSLTPLVALSVSAAVSSSLETNTAERLMWLDSVFASIDPTDVDIKEVAPKIMDVLSSRLQAAYMQIAEKNPGDPVLRRISMLSRRAQELKNAST
ncbi:wd40 yvtn repeat-like-containing domain [Diplodia corticola]|uniref:Wd40 yvtn repeat-like-containing domain n=1 Tax=Diplodia corticola TaxID=236234 RepID=A0A1J9RL17_9PEZI|nr:wd40 yvtn repeat-like-containing domain [Diplodia corticola]OJD29207.1 wd40 yvtn repeat-like-containing domain [Diplodia corticola]